jgi:hypothetical protein
MSRYFHRVPLTINHDWEPTIRAAKKMMAFEQYTDSTPYPPDAGELGSAHFDLKSLGVLSKNYKSPNWYRIAGPLIVKTMPWLPTMISDLKDLGPDDGAISFLTGNAAEHVDQPKDLSALNYIFYNTDPEAHTYVKHDDYCDTYPSIVGETWILDATARHGILNAGERWNLSVHFSAPYSDLKAWFDRTGPMVY